MNPLSRSARSFVGWLSVVFAVLGVALIAGIARDRLQRADSDSTPLTRFGQGQRERQFAALRTYAARAELGSLIPQTDAVLAVREQFLQSALTLSLPFRQYFNDGQYVARLDSADVHLESGLAMVTLEGRGMLAGQEDSPLYVDLFLRGFLSLTGVDPDSGTLRAALVITDMRSRRSRLRIGDTPLNPVARYFGRLKAEDWNRTGQLVHLPLHIDQQIVLPEIDGDVSIPESRVPISVGVAAVTTLRGHMVISLALLPDSASGERAEPADPRWNLEPRLRRTPAEWIRDLRHPQRLLAEEDSLQAEVDRLAARDPLWNAVFATDHDIVAIVPAPVLATVVARASRRYLRGVEMDIRPKANLSVNTSLRFGVLNRRVGVGRLRGQIHISHLTARLAVTGAPRLRLEAPDELTIIAPVRVIGGHGTLDLDMKWAPKFFVSMVCRGFQFQERLSGEVLPTNDTLKTHIRYVIQDSVILCRPRIERDTVRLSADLTEGSWQKVLDKLVQQDRFGRCGLVMNPDSVLAKLRKLAGGGVALHLPAKAFKPFKLPVVLESVYSSGPYQIDAMAFDPAIEVVPRYLRLAFRVNLQVKSMPLAPQTSAAAPRARP